MFGEIQDDSSESDDHTVDDVGTVRTNSSNYKGDVESTEESVGSVKLGCDDDNVQPSAKTFGLGYKFIVPFLNKAKEEENIVGEVVGMGDRQGDRLVKYNNMNESATNELLHTTDLENLEEVPLFDYSLAVGDTIETERQRSPLDASEGTELVTVVSTVWMIGHPTMRGEKATTSISRSWQTALDSAQPRFCIVSSCHDDAPPAGEWTDINSVNLIWGVITKDARSRTKPQDEK